MVETDEMESDGDSVILVGERSALPSTHHAEGHTKDGPSGNESKIQYILVKEPQVLIECNPEKVIFSDEGSLYGGEDLMDVDLSPTSDAN